MSETHKVVTDALQTLGTIIGTNEGRDAIHLAVEPVTAGEMLRAGEHVGFLQDGTVGESDKSVGIVDPFITGKIRKGQRFWLVVYPRQITSLRHVWEHPGFPKPTDNPALASASPSERFLREFADSIRVGYDELLQNATWFVESNGNDYWVQGGRFEGQSLPEEFWSHYETVTGKTVPEDCQHSFFSCSC